MKFRDSINETIQYLLSNKTKTILTMVGISIGIMSIISMLSIGNAAKLSIEKDIQSMGANIIQIIPNSEFLRTGKQKIDLFSDQDLKNISKVDGVRIPYGLNSVTGQTIYKNNKQNLMVMGSNLEFHKELNSEFLSGRNFTQNEVNNYNKVVTIGEKVAKDLFGNKSPIGENIKINGVSFRVVGINKTIKFALGLNNFENRIFMPVTTMQRYLIGKNEYSFLWVQLYKETDANLAKDEIYKTLTKVRGLKEDSQIKYFRLFSSDDLMKTIGTVTNVFTILLASIAGISLIVAGIGIMNMMLTTVMERTKEIGLRKAVGAQANDISNQFLIESVSISFMGGLFGVLFGVGLANLVTGVFMKIDSGVNISYILFAFILCSIIGVGFGYYPAKRAAKLNPIEALRYE